MISVICVYNDERTLREVLLKGLQRQNVEFQLITVDNTDNKYRSAAEALNDAARGATGRYLMFVHQDAGLSSESVLETLEARLDTLRDVGIAGTVGRTEDGQTRGCILGPSQNVPSDMAHLVHPVSTPEVVQILDEGALIIPKSVFNRMQFDPGTFDGWHCYGADYCLSVRKIGLKAYVLPGSSGAYHASAWTNVEGLLKYQRRLYHKHRHDHKRIYLTTCDRLSGWNLMLLGIAEAFRKPYRRVFPEWPTILRRELSGCETLLDLDSGWNSPVRQCGIPLSIAIESRRPSLDASRGRRTHNQYLLADVRRIEFHPKSVDAVVAINLLDLIDERERQALLHRMERWARKRVVIVTQNQRSCRNSPSGQGNTGCEVSALRRLGFKVFGINGWKRLGGPDCATRSSLLASLLLRAARDMSQEVAYHCPRAAFQLLAVKEVSAAQEDNSQQKA